MQNCSKSRRHRPENHSQASASTARSEAMIETRRLEILSVCMWRMLAFHSGLTANHPTITGHQSVASAEAAIPAAWEGPPRVRSRFAQQA